MQMHISAIHDQLETLDRTSLLSRWTREVENGARWDGRREITADGGTGGVPTGEVSGDIIVLQKMMIPTIRKIRVVVAVVVVVMMMTMMALLENLRWTRHLVPQTNDAVTAHPGREGAG